MWWGRHFSPCGKAQFVQGLAPSPRGPNPRQHWGRMVPQREGRSLCSGPPAAWGDISIPVTLGMPVLGAISYASSCVFWQSEEDKQLQDELEMLVERLGVSLCCTQLTVVPCAVEVVCLMLNGAPRCPLLSVLEPCCLSDCCFPLMWVAFCCFFAPSAGAERGSPGCSAQSHGCV